MVDPDILAQEGTTKDRLREIFTCNPPGQTDVLTEQERKRKQKDYEIRQAFEDEIGRCLSENVQFALRNYQLYSAIDLAWDAPPINKNTYPMILYAQGKLDLGQCAKQLSEMKCADLYVQKNDKGEPIGIDVPKFYEVNVNLVRSVITRRLAAQSNKFANLYPHYKYEPRSTSLVGKLRADVVSQVMDIMSDQFDYRHHEVQVFRDTLLYGHSVDFMRSAWEREVQWRKKIVDGATTEKKIAIETVISKEGVGWVNPHPSRVYWDNNYPLSSINTDTGCEYIGFWDVCRWKDISKNTMYWNRDAVGYTSSMVQLFSTYAQYFSQYYCTITPPCSPDKIPCASNGNFDLSSQNDRKNNVGFYAQSQPESALVIAHHYQKLIPKDHCIGDYPFPVWVHFVVAGFNTVVYAEILPTSPAAACSYNENDSRQVNISLGHELMPYQDQMTNLTSLLLLTIKACNQRVTIIDIDTMTADGVKKVREQCKGKNYYTENLVVEVSRTKMRELGIEVDDVVKLIETNPGAAVDVIFRSMMQLIQLAERLMALSPQEQGQPAPREISATETNIIAGTTESVYGFISDSYDEYRNARKRILYESYMAFGNPELRIPVINRYSPKVVEMAGFSVVEDEAEDFNETDANIPKRHTITGNKRHLLYDYIFTSRDGAERSVNTQSANVLVQLMGVLQQPVIAAAIGKEKLYEIVNEIFRMSGAGIDLKLELKEGENNAIGLDVNQQVQQILAQLTQQAEQTSSALQQVDQTIQGLNQQFLELAQRLKAVETNSSRNRMDEAKIELMREKAQMDRARGVQELSQKQETHEQEMDLKALDLATDIEIKGATATAA